MYIRNHYTVNDHLVKAISSHLHITPDTSTEPRQMVISRKDFRYVLCASLGLPVEFDLDLLDHFANLYREAYGIQKAEITVATRSAAKYFRLAFAIDLGHYLMIHEADVHTLINALKGGYGGLEDQEGLDSHLAYDASEDQEDILEASDDPEAIKQARATLESLLGGSDNA